MPKRDPNEDIFREIEGYWVAWPDRKVPSDTGNMLDFYHWLERQDPGLVRINDQTGDWVWQRIKHRLISFEERHGRSIFSKPA